jgi:hypothetical protein
VVGVVLNLALFFGYHVLWPTSERRNIMKWITRERPKIDRIACPWLVARFIDESPEFLYVPAGDVMRIASETGATPYDVPGVELGHHGEQCSFDAFIEKYQIKDAPLAKLALIVRAADCGQPELAKEYADAIQAMA